MVLGKRFLILLALALQVSGVGMAPAAPAAPAVASLTVYTDARGAGWDDWSWGGVTNNFSSTAAVHNGSYAISVQYTGGWSGMQMGASSPQSTANANTLVFWIKGGGSGGQAVRVSAGSSCATASIDLTLTTVWTQVSLSLAGLGTPAAIQSVSWFNPTDHAQTVFYVDDVLLTSTAVTPPAVQAGPALSVDAAAGRHAISPYIYGLNFPDESLAAELRLPVQRWGGNSATRYNYLNDITNTANDWYFENIPSVKSDPAKLPDGSDADRFIEQGLRTGTQTLLTVPLIGWTPKNQPAGSTARICGFSVSKYGPQQATDVWAPDCGNGVKPNGTTMVTGNNPTDTSTAITPAFVQGWIQYLKGKYGAAGSGGVQFYDLDNEPMLWNSTHRDVHPQPTSYDELVNRTLAYAPAIKAADPGALTLGPVLWGWDAYFYSALDVAQGGDWWNHPADRLAHGNTPFVEWYLQQMRDYQQAHGQRILDFLDLHYYPQSFDSVSDAAGDAATQQMRLRSTRSLWDPTYVDESWVNDTVQLLPRMHGWVNTDYPGTKLAISEYSWGAMCHINGALAEADVLGIFGQQGLDLATLWGPPQPDEPGAFAFRMYRSVDGTGFGEVGVKAASADSSQLAVYGAVRGADGALTVMVINKSGSPLSASLALNGFAPASSAHVYRYSGDRQDQVVTLPDLPVSSSGFQAVYPASSITLYVIPPAHQHTVYLPSLLLRP